MSKKIVRLTEGDLYRVIKESVNKILNEEYQINLDMNGKQGFQNVRLWQAAASEIQQKGSTIINIPLSYDKFIHARLMQTQRGGVYLETDGINKEFTSISDAFTVLRQHAEQKYNELKNQY